ncbi:TonB-dependent receptor [Dinghuibacter silviterrae]|uniref:Carboxypeptidase family protein n=1 Tax=Dinghuibacter silviterrae TaxID=1539049 RepID=A0A4R8DQS7_9BACT|nr:TonB-dependent receptor [Dinghuibacter silviterrae]TDW99764.1 carboxypeptidase family protein [Dinghuibacter silviterrae]
MKISTCKALCTILFCVFLGTAVRAQQGKIVGKVFSTTREGLGGATISLQLSRDTTVTKQTVVTDSTGKFVFSNVPLGAYRVHATALNYQDANKPVRLTAVKPVVLLDSVFLGSAFQSMGGIVITVPRRQAAVKNDTTEFNAGAYHVRANGTTEDLFKKVPGLEVDQSGTVKAQGEQVTQIYVDGKPFMGSDLKTVMENFPADVIDKVQIIDKKSDQALATGVEDGQHTKIINITLKKNRKRGIFGNDYVGVGTEGRYEAKTNTNLFNNNRKLTIVAGGNNDGRSDNSNSTSGTTDATYNNWNGVTDYKQLKLNFANKIGKGFDYSLYAGYDQYKTDREQRIDRQNIFTDSSTYYHEINSTHSTYRNGNGGLYFEFRPDTLNFMRFNETVGYAHSTSQTNASYTTLLADSTMVNNGTRFNSNTTDNPFVNGNISYSHRFKGTHRSLFLNFSNNINNTTTGTNNITYDNYTPPDTTPYQQFVNQYQHNPSRNTALGAAASYTEPISQRSSLNLSYNYDYGRNDIPQTAYDYNTVTQKYDLPNDTLTDHFAATNYQNNVSLNYRYGTATYGFGAGVRWLDAVINSQSFGKDTSNQQSYKGFAPNLSFYSNGKNRHFYAYYNFSVQAPTATQLTPLVNNSNPLYLVLGNPNLHYAQTHSVHYSYSFYNPKKDEGFNSNATFNDVVDYISNSTTVDNTTGAQVTQPVNLNGAYNYNGWFSYFRPFPFGEKDKLRWNVNLWTQGGKNSNLLNGTDNVNTSNYTRVYMGLTYDSHQWLDLHTDMSLARQESDYSLEPNLNNVAYFLDISPNITFQVAPRTEVNIDYDYRQSTGQSAGFNTSVNMLNADFVQYFDNKKDIWLKVKGYDLLNQNVSVWRTTGSNYIQDTRSNVLTRFVLVSLNVRINKFLAPPPPPKEINMGDPGRPDVM